jgi:hypothetical protein
MSKDEDNFTDNFRLTIVLAMGIAGCAVGGVCPMLIGGDQGAGLFSLFYGVVAGILGLIIGVLSGFLLSLLVRSTGGTESSRRSTGGPQLVGELCTFCGKTIASIASGGFCPDCHCPAHYQCKNLNPASGGSICPRCGADLSKCGYDANDQWTNSDI